MINNHPNLQSGIIIRCQHLKKTFHDGRLNADVLSGVNLQVQAGERIAIMGVSGSGKSTLLHLLGGLDLPTSGHIYIADKNMTLANEKERSRLRYQFLGFVYQFHHLLPEFNLLENVSMPLLFGKMPIKQAREKAAYLLSRVGLAKRMQHRLSELSGGERQRAAIARALVTDPACVLADEPTGNLDQRTAMGVYALILELNASLGTSFIIATHDVKLAQNMQRIVFLKNGELHEHE